MRTPFTGVGTALVTPFTSSGAVDEAGGPPPGAAAGRGGRALPRALRHDRRGADASAEEKRRVVEIVVEEARGRVPVLAGAGGYDTREVVEAARAMHEAGADGLLSVTPYYNKPTPEGLFRHYEAIAGATPLPDRGLQRAGPDRLQRGPRDPRPPRVDPARGRGEGGLGQHDPDLRGAEGGRPATSSSSPATTPSTLPAMAVGARGVISVASNEVPARDGAARGGGRAERLRRRPRDPRAAPPAHARELRRVEPHPGEGRHGADGPARGDLPAAHGPAPARETREKLLRVLAGVGLVPAGARA